MRYVVEKLLFSSDFTTISLTSNRPNITYATWPITGSLNNFRNPQFLIPDAGNEPFDLQMIPKTLIFYDDREEAENAAKFLSSIRPESMRKNRIAKHYHSMMSEEYLEDIFQDFSFPQGTT